MATVVVTHAHLASDAVGVLRILTVSNLMQVARVHKTVQIQALWWAALFEKGASDLGFQPHAQRPARAPGEVRGPGKRGGRKHL